ncbi:MAG TPA: putative 2OG-Fe(II) oxygenase [Usitatibacter sp.]
MTDRAADAARWRTALASNPNDRIAWHNLASAQGDLGRAAEAEAAARRAIELGIAAPETRLVLARALQAQRRLDEAEKAFDEAISLRPDYLDAQRDLAQLVWMRTARSDLALARIDRGLRSAPRDAGLYLIRSIVLEIAGDRDAAFAAVVTGLNAAPRDVPLLLQAAHLCAEMNEAARALQFARQADKIAPTNIAAGFGLCEALLAAGELDEADRIAAVLCAAQPRNQYAIALQATAWRLGGDPRYGELYRYDTLVEARKLDTPAGWKSLDDFLHELKRELDAMHSYTSHPLQQSVRGGSQLPLNAPELEHPLVAALFASISGAVGRYIAGTGPKGFAISGAWSVRLRSGGYHTDHVHPEGWISSACYIALPESVTSGTHFAGWLRFGKPGIATKPALAPDHYVKPEPGLLVLFPAYMWHGVEPFESPEPRLTVAFDVVPEDPR